MRISDWSADVCSSDLLPVVAGIGLLGPLLGGAIVILLVPAFYWIVRTMLTGAAIVAERPLGAVRAVKRGIALTRGNGLVLAALIALVTRSEERRVGEECVSTCRSRGPAEH